MGMEPTSLDLSSCFELVELPSNTNHDQARNHTTALTLPLVSLANFHFL